MPGAIAEIAIAGRGPAVRNCHEPTNQPTGIRPCQPGAGGGRQLGRAGLPGRGRHAALHPAGGRRPHVGRGGQGLHRLRGLVGAGHCWSLAPRGAEGRAGGRGRWPVVRRAQCARDRAGAENLRHVPARRAGALHQFRHGIHDVGPAAGAGLHGPQPHHQVRGLLPRHGRQPAGEGGQRCAGFRQPQLGRRARGRGQAHAHRPLQRSGQRSPPVRAVPR